MKIANGFIHAQMGTLRHSPFEWDGRNEKGEIMASGVYVYSTQNSDGETVTKNIVVMK